MTTAAPKYTEARTSHWNQVARKSDGGKSKGHYYHKRITHIYQFLVPPGQHILEIGCGTGDLLAALKPASGVGTDFSSEMIKRGKNLHSEIRFIEADAHNLSEIEETFDVIILSDLVNDLWDVQTVFKVIRRLSTSRTKVIINFYSRVWELPLKLVQKLGLANPTLMQNWLTAEDINDLLSLSDFEAIRNWTEILWPLDTTIVSTLLNRYLVKLWPFRYFALTNFIIARPIHSEKKLKDNPIVSVIVPARNEAGNIEKIVERTPEMGGGTELIFVEGNSKDNTYEVIEKTLENNPGRNLKLFKQPGVGKGDAVRLGFDKANGEILMILDADMTVPPEDLSRFHDALVQGKCEFANGVRLVYPMERQAMRYLNFLGNKFFSLAFSWLLGQPIKDTLCGTKVLWREDYEIIAANRDYFGDFDPFGDFDLIFGAARLNYKIIDIPIRYHERKYGTTNIDRWRHGWLLIKMVLFAMKKIKFV